MSLPRPLTSTIVSVLMGVAALGGGFAAMATLGTRPATPAATPAQTQAISETAPWLAAPAEAGGSGRPGEGKRENERAPDEGPSPTTTISGTPSTSTTTIVVTTEDPAAAEPPPSVTSQTGSVASRSTFP